MASLRFYWGALLLWAIIQGLIMLSTVNSVSMRQALVPHNLLGRTQSAARVLSWSVIPLGTFVGGLVIQQIRNSALIYGMIGALLVFIGFAFAFTPLSRAERYLPSEEFT